MNEPLCSSSPTLYLKMHHVRWAPILYLNEYNEVDNILSQIRHLVANNCKDGQIESIKIVGYRVVSYRPSDDIRYLSTENTIYHQEPFDKNAPIDQWPRSISRIFYFGATFPDDDFSKLWPNDLNGMSRYKKYFQHEEDRYQRRKEKKRRRQLSNQQAAQVRNIQDFCRIYKDICVRTAIRIGTMIFLKR